MRVFGVLLVFALVGAAVTSATPVAACSGFDVQLDQDACGSLAVSVLGDAHAQEDCTASVSCVAVSAAGAADASSSQSCGASGLVSASCIAVGGAGAHAGGERCGGDVGFFGNSGVAAECLAVSPGGEASTRARDGCGHRPQFGVFVQCGAVSGTGQASSDVAGREFNPADCGTSRTGAVHVSCFAASGGGDATQSAGAHCARSWSGVSVGCVAVSGMGDASQTQTDSVSSCGESLVGVAVGCVAVSVTGNAHQDADATGAPRSECGRAQWGAAVGCGAVAPVGDVSAARHHGQLGCGRVTGDAQVVPFLEGAAVGAAFGCFETTFAWLLP